jgi:hypothetical protein
MCVSLGWVSQIWPSTSRRNKWPIIKYFLRVCVHVFVHIICGLYISSVYNVTCMNNYSAIANSHTLQFTTARTKSSQSLCLHRLSPGNGFNAVASSASVLTPLQAGDYITTNCYCTEFKSYVMTDGQSASLSWNKALIWVLPPDFFITVRQMQVCWCGAFSLTRRRVCRLQLLLALVSAVILGSESYGTRDNILLSQIRDFHFLRLLRLAGLRWRYSTPSPYGINCYSKSKSKSHCDWRSVSQ